MKSTQPGGAKGGAVPAVVPSPVAPDDLRRFTAARVGLGRAGSSLTTRAHLAFVGDHARARDAVWTAVDFEALAARVEGLGVEPLRLQSEAGDRATYLRRPDLGRRLDAASVEVLARAARSGPSRLALVIADGLSAEAVDANAVALLAELLPALEEAGLGPRHVALVQQGRVAIGDPVAQGLGAEIVVVLIGERPGLSAADSLGCYLTWSPQPGTPDSRRNCVSNIRRGGLDPKSAASRIAWLVREALARRTSGIELKEASPVDDSGKTLPPG